MKNLRHVLFFVAALLVSNILCAQATISVRAPGYYVNVASSLPVELFVKPFTTGCYLIPASELTALTGSNITSFGIHLFIGNLSGVASGTIDVYLKNTNDINYSQGSNFSSAISSMNNVYSGTTAIAATSSTTDVNCQLPTSFTYTGGGLYVAFSWSAGVSSGSSALYSYGSSSVSFGVNKAQNGYNAAMNTMTTTAYRPTFVFGLTNMATNEASVEGILEAGRIATAVEVDQTVEAYVKNNSINPLSNVQVSLSISGVNTYTNVQTVPIIAPGAVVTVTFATYTPSALGSQTLTVTIPTDQNQDNNIKVLTQSLTCNQAGNGQPTNDYFQLVSFQGILAGKFNFNRQATMKAVRMSITSTGLNDVVHGVLLNANGVVLARTNTVTITSPMMYTFHTFSFATTQMLQANTDYFIGMALPVPNLSTLGSYRLSDGRPGITFGVFPLAGGTFTLGRPALYGIEPVLNGSITVTPTLALVCKGETLTLTPSGSANYIWNDAAGNILNSLTDGKLELVATVSQNYNINGTNLGGCATQGTMALLVDLCTSIAEKNGSGGLSLYPNPVTHGRLTISGVMPHSSIIFYGAMGEEVYATTVDSENATLVLPELSAGCYFLKTTALNQEERFVKFVLVN